MPNQFQEYPKHVYPDPDDRKKYVVVNSEEEEHLALKGTPIVRDEDERKRLLAVAEVNDLQVDGRWSIGRMKKVIADAGFDPEANPFA